MSYLIRDLFNSTFKTNPSMEHGVMRGITRVSKESIFSGLNNLNVITTTSRQYETAFGFTEDLPGIIIEFKVQNENAGEETLSDTADIALQQIEAKDYASDLKSEGVEDILKYGFAFAGKKVFIKKR